MPIELGEESFADLLLSRGHLLDVRSSSEFEKASIPCSFNIPILTDEQRHLVGLCYKQHGQESAVALGHKLVSGGSKQALVNKWDELVKSANAQAVLCWRGGKRSTIAQQWLSEVGIELPRISGGYKALRSFLLRELSAALEELELVIVAGRTGSGKTTFLHRLDHQHSFIDLEDLAKHRGSAYGAVFGSQPSQATFENHLAIELLRLKSNKIRRILIESESRLVGRLALPKQLIEKMSRAPVVMLEVGEEQRVNNIIEDYILKNPICSTPKASGEALGQLELFLTESTKKLEKRLGGLRTKAILEMIRNACSEQQSNGEFSTHKEWIGELLRSYYDPLYEKHITGYESRIIFSGAPDKASQFLGSLANKTPPQCSIEHT